MQRNAQNVFEAQKYGGHFMTNDRRVVARADQIYALCGLSPVKPTAFLAIVRKAMGDAGGTQSGPIVGGGALFELALTTRLALTFRAAANSAHLDSGWSTAGALTGGIAIY